MSLPYVKSLIPKMDFCILDLGLGLDRQRAKRAFCMAAAGCSRKMKETNAMSSLVSQNCTIRVKKVKRN